MAALEPLDAEVVCIEADEVPLFNLCWSSFSESTVVIRLQQAEQNTGKGELSGGKCFVMVCPDETCNFKVKVRKSVEKAQKYHPW